MPLLGFSKLTCIRILKKYECITQCLTRMSYEFELESLNVCDQVLYFDGRFGVWWWRGVQRQTSSFLLAPLTWLSLVACWSKISAGAQKKQSMQKKKNTTDWLFVTVPSGIQRDSREKPGAAGKKRGINKIFKESKLFCASLCVWVCM